MDIRGVQGEIRQDMTLIVNFKLNGVILSVNAFINGLFLPLCIIYYLPAGNRDDNSRFYSLLL